MPKSGKLHEHSFNIELGKLLRNLSPVWKDKTRRKVETEKLGKIKGKRPDLVISFSNSPPVVIEVSYTRKDADQDAKSRIGQRIRHSAPVRTSVAMVPPEGTKDLSSEEDVPEFLKEKLLEYAVYFRGNARFPESGWIQGDLHDFAEFLLATKIPPSTLHDNAKLARDVIEEAATVLSNKLDTAAKEQISSIMHEAEHGRAIHSACLCMFNALHAQDFVCTCCPTPLPRSACRNNLASGKLLPQRVIDSWSRIQKINYRSIYKIAQESLQVATSHPTAASEALNILDLTIEQILAEGIDPGQELAQAIFPLIVQDRKESAAFYTRAPVASLLVHLAWPDKENLMSVLNPDGTTALPRIGDFACGTGRLLDTSYGLVREAAERVGIDPLDIHKEMAENRLTATDIYPTATHLTATAITMQEPGIPCLQTRIGVTPVTSPQTRAGSLQLIHDEWIPDLFQLNRTSGDAGQISARHESFDFVAMNPPYSRTRGGQRMFDLQGQTDSQRKASQQQASLLARNTPANTQAGLATLFLYLAHKKLKPRGRIAMVLPLTAASAESWRATREFLEKNYTDIICATHSGGSSKKQAMSEDTGLGEMLLIAKKSPPRSKTAKITSVNLAYKISTQLAGRCLAQSISKAINHRKSSSHGQIMLAGKLTGSYVRENVLQKGNPWKGLGLLDSSLAKTMKKLEQAEIWSPICSKPVSLPPPPPRKLFGTDLTHRPGLGRIQCANRALSENCSAPVPHIT